METKSKAYDKKWCGQWNVECYINYTISKCLNFELNKLMSVRSKQNKL